MLTRIDGKIYEISDAADDGDVFVMDEHTGIVYQGFADGGEEFFANMRAEVEHFLSRKKTDTTRKMLGV